MSPTEIKRMFLFLPRGFTGFITMVGMLLFFCGSAFAQYVGGPIQIQSAFAHSSSVTVSDTNPVHLVLVTIKGMSHGRSGDLHATLSHTTTNNITTDVDLFSRPGVSSSSPFGATSPTSGDYSFADSAAETFSAAAIAAGSGVVPNGTYHPSQSDGTATPVLSFLSLFNGQIAAGTWELTMSDGAPGIDGSLDSWELDLVTALPQLSIFPTDTNAALLEWPAPSTGFVLQANTNLIGSGWTNVPNAVTNMNGTNEVTVSPVTGNSFFRLFHP